MISCFFFTSAQQQFTIYDDIPGHCSSIKPSYQEGFPEWAKMLYQDEINYNEISIAFDKWEQSGEKTFRSVRRYYKNWSKAILPYADSYGTIRLPDMDEYRNALYKNQKATAGLSSSRSEGEWTFLGPKETYYIDYGGSSTLTGTAAWQVNVYSFDIAETNENILYLGTETGFINKTIDKGSTWSQVGLDYNFGGGINDIIIHPLNEDIVYAAGGQQIHKTLNGGVTWTPMVPLDYVISSDKIEMDPDDNEKIYAAAKDGLYITTNGGSDWTKVYDARAYDVQRHPVNPNIVYGLVIVDNIYAIIISIDGGQTFAIDNSFPDDIALVNGGLIATSAADPEKLYAMVLTSNNTPYIYKKSDGVWSIIATGRTDEFPGDNGQGYYDFVFEVSDHDPNLIFAGTTSLYKSENAGETFTAVGGYIGDFYIHPDIQDLRILDDGEIWVSTDGGISYSSDYFSETSNYSAKLNGVVGSDMWGFDQGWNEDIVVGGRYHNGNISIADFYGSKALRMGGAESPTGWVVKGKSRRVVFDELGDGFILPTSAEAQQVGRFKFGLHPNMDNSGRLRGNLVYHPNYFGTITMCSGNALWQSEDSGVSYSMISAFDFKVRYFDISNHNPDIIYADVLYSGLKKSEDGGLTWESKPSLTTMPNGDSGWLGKLFFAISPTDENTLYACQQNSSFNTADNGRIFKSIDGGDTWEDWTNGLSVYTKGIVVQSNENGDDLVYLFTNARDKIAQVLTRGENDEEWEDYSDGYPAGFRVNLALPFYRDSKLRVSGNGGVWESALKDKNFAPIINPWVERYRYKCATDTVFFNDHSMIDHEGAEWTWAITPDPVYISDANSRNPKVVLGNVGEYDVTITITKNGVGYSKTIEDMVVVLGCPSIENCDNPADIPKDDWSLVSVSSEDLNQPGRARMAFDNNLSTIWHTDRSSDDIDYPHEMIVDMGASYNVNSFTNEPRQYGIELRIKDFELYVSEDLNDWGAAVATGQFADSSGPTIVSLDDQKIGRYFRIVCLSEINNETGASVAEFTLKGCDPGSVNTQEADISNKLAAYPVPSSGMVFVDLPTTGEVNYTLYNLGGEIIQKGMARSADGNQFAFDLSERQSGTYFVKAESESGVIYTMKVVKI